MLSHPPKDDIIFKTDDSNITFDKSLRKEMRIQTLVFGNKYLNNADKRYEIEPIEGMHLPPFFAWAHLSCCLFTPGAYI